MLLHFTLVISRLSDQSKVLAQQVGMLSERLAAAEQRAAPEQQTAADVDKLRSGHSNLTPAR